jgi:hypothetical protein
MTNSWVNHHNREISKVINKEKAIKFARIVMEAEPLDEIDYMIARCLITLNYENEQLKFELEQCQRRYSELAQTIQQHIINSKGSKNV